MKGRPFLVLVRDRGPDPARIGVALWWLWCTAEGPAQPATSQPARCLSGAVSFPRTRPLSALHLLTNPDGLYWPTRRVWLQQCSRRRAVGAVEERLR